MNSPTLRAGRLLALAVLAGSLGNAAAVPKPANEWLWLSSQMDGATCIVTTTVTWSGFREARYVEVFLTDGYAGAKQLPTVVRIQSKDGTAVVQTALVASPTWVFGYHPWAQLLDNRQAAIPASLDFAGQLGGYCQLP